MILFLGFYALIVHKPMNLRNIRYFGIFFILLSLLILSHFTLHKYLIGSKTNYFSALFSWYIHALKIKDGSIMVGGGIIGGTLFYVFYYLFDQVGTIFISIFLFFIGIVFLCKKTLKEFTISCIHGLKYAWKKVNGVKTEVHHTFQEFDEDLKESIEVAPVVLSRFKVDKVDLAREHATRLEEAKRYYQLLESILHELSIYGAKIDYYLSNHVVVFRIESKLMVKAEELARAIEAKLVSSFLLKYDVYHQAILVEINLMSATPLSFFEAFSSKEQGLILGKDDRNEMVQIDEDTPSCVIFGKEELTYSYFLSLFVYAVLKKEKNKKIVLIDYSKSYDKVKNYASCYDTTGNILSTLVEELDEILHLLSSSHVSNRKKYNELYPDKIGNHYVFIYGLEQLIDNDSRFREFMYLIKTGSDAGFYFVLCQKDSRIVPSSFYSSFSYLIAMDKSVSYIQEQMKDLPMNKLAKSLECFARTKDLLFRLNLLLLSEKEKEKMDK
jgi:hypothetical protein